MKNRRPMTTEPAATLDLEVQYIVKMQGIPTQADFSAWAVAALPDDNERRELLVRIVDEAESRSLNARYRGKDAPTNVLSFPFEAPPGVGFDHLGDLVICAPVVLREAAEQNKPPEHHWAHMLVHGVLHLRGYDHIEPAQAADEDWWPTSLCFNLDTGPFTAKEMRRAVPIASTSPRLRTSHLAAPLSWRTCPSRPIRASCLTSRRRNRCSRNTRPASTT